MYGGAAWEEEPNGFFEDLWNGEAPLVRAFWLYFALGNALWLAAIAYLLVIPFLSDDFQLNVPTMAAGALIAVMIYPVYAIVTGVAVIRSGARYASENRAQVWKQVCGRLGQGLGLAGLLLPFLLIAALILPL